LGTTYRKVNERLTICETRQNTGFWLRYQWIQRISTLLQQFVPTSHASSADTVKRQSWSSVKLPAALRGRERLSTASSNTSGQRVLQGMSRLAALSQRKAEGMHYTSAFAREQHYINTARRALQSGIAPYYKCTQCRSVH